ncbi:MAG: type II toxin-antitoxin system RelE/ParE family toxin [Caulobacteraceae bacterium]
MAVRYRPAFVDDLEEAYAYLLDRSPQAAELLLARADHLVGLLDDFQSMGRRREDLGLNLRSMRVRGFLI